VTLGVMIEKYRAHGSLKTLKESKGRWYLHRNVTIFISDSGVGKRYFLSAGVTKVTLHDLIAVATSCGA